MPLLASHGIYSNQIESYFTRTSVSYYIYIYNYGWFVFHIYIYKHLYLYMCSFYHSIIHIPDNQTHIYIYRYILHKHICIYDLGLLKLHLYISIIYIYMNKTYKVHYQIHNDIVTYHIAMMIIYHKNITIY